MWRSRIMSGATLDSQYVNLICLLLCVSWKVHPICSLSEMDQTRWGYNRRLCSLLCNYLFILNISISYFDFSRVEWRLLQSLVTSCITWNVLFPNWPEYIFILCYVFCLVLWIGSNPFMHGLSEHWNLWVTLKRCMISIQTLLITTQHILESFVLACNVEF